MAASLLTIPAELRLRIYEYHLASLEDEVRAVAHGRSTHDRRIRQKASVVLKDHTTLLLACSLINNEYGPLLCHLLKSVFAYYCADSSDEMASLTSFLTKHNAEVPKYSMLREDHTHDSESPRRPLLAKLHRMGVLSRRYLDESFVKQCSYESLTLWRLQDNKKIVIWYMRRNEQGFQATDIWMEGPLATLDWENDGNESGKWRTVEWYIPDQGFIASLTNE
ncbi:hypothetical protein PRZ48_008546 [Zasmidium cellare]|uniref:Uncharacterized protein n=1 Tax=Zasmidium cellare TaxID=395010 RepID=A0ABR0EFR9_ZASCE|nr:hypothetical protein PRZ48_008546 [Zasmidium cellare]